MFEDEKEEWRPATIEEVWQIVVEDLASCDELKRATFSQFAVDPYYPAINRYGNEEQVVVVARKGNEAMYWEDVEEGFNISPLSNDGRVLKHYCNQDSLGRPLNFWIDR